MSVEETIVEIKKELRANMNGVASARMREAGLNYHVNFGIDLPRLQEIARQFTPSHELAQQLWHENVRESKILAGLLMPVERFWSDVADIWVEQMPNAEIAQLTVMNLFSRLPYASDKAFEWMGHSDEMFQLCGFLLITRLLMQGAVLTERSRNEVLDQANSLQESPNLHLRKAVLNAIARIDQTKDDLAKRENR